MKPFTAWLAMEKNGKVPAEFWTRSVMRDYVQAYVSRMDDPPDYSLRVLIVADTPENRKKLGMEESCRS